MSDNSVDNPPLLSTRLQRLIEESTYYMYERAKKGAGRCGCQAWRFRTFAFDVITPRHAKAEESPFVPAHCPRQSAIAEQ